MEHDRIRRSIVYPALAAQFSRCCRWESCKDVMSWKRVDEVSKDPYGKLHLRYERCRFDTALVSSGSKNAMRGPYELDVFRFGGSVSIYRSFHDRRPSQASGDDASFSLYDQACLQTRRLAERGSPSCQMHSTSSDQLCASLCCTNRHRSAGRKCGMLGLFE